MENKMYSMVDDYIEDDDRKDQKCEECGKKLKAYEEKEEGLCFGCIAREYDD